MPVTRQQFEAVFPSLVEDLVKHAAKTQGIPKAYLDWYERVWLSRPFMERSSENISNECLFF